MKLIINGKTIGAIKEAYVPQTPTTDRYDLKDGFSVVIYRKDIKACTLKGDIHITLKKGEEE